MRTFAILSLLVLAGCAHVASTRATFYRQTDQPLALTIKRHLDTIVNGPDTEEDQVLILELRNVAVGKRLLIPSDDVAARFSAYRFGPESQGMTYRGYIVVKSIAPQQIVAAIKLEVSAQTVDGSYTQTVRFRGDYTFVSRPPAD